MSLINLAFKFFASWNFILSSILLASLHVRKINSLRLLVSKLSADWGLAVNLAAILLKKRNRFLIVNKVKVNGLMFPK